MGVRFAEKIQVVPVISPESATDQSNESAFVALENAQWVSFLLQIGALETDSDDLITLTVVTGAASSTGAADTAIPFKYRVASVGTDSWSAITDGTTAGVRIEATTDNNKAYWIDVDPASIPALDADAAYVYLNLATTTITAGSVSACAFIEPRYPQNANLTSS